MAQGMGKAEVGDQRTEIGDQGPGVRPKEGRSKLCLLKKRATGHCPVALMTR